jgi:hypothetical protein
MKINEMSYTWVIREGNKTPKSISYVKWDLVNYPLPHRGQKSNKDWISRVEVFKVWYEVNRGVDKSPKELYSIYLKNCSRQGVPFLGYHLWLFDFQNLSMDMHRYFGKAVNN